MYSCKYDLHAYLCTQSTLDMATKRNLQIYDPLLYIVGMMGYGMAKAAVHQLVKSLASKNSGLPKNSSALAILP